MGEVHIHGFGIAPGESAAQLVGVPPSARTQNDDLHVYYAFQRDSRHEPNAQGNTVPGFGDQRGGHRQVLTVNETHVFSQALVNEMRAGYNRISISFNPKPGDAVKTEESAKTIAKEK